jgi:chaperonin GroES
MATATKTSTSKTKATAAPRSPGRTVAAPTALKLRPLGDRVVLEPAPGEEMTKSGIVIPDTVKEKPQQGMVLTVGPGRILDDGKRERIDLKRGDRVLYAKYAGTEFKLDGRELLIIGSKDILAVIER